MKRLTVFVGQIVLIFLITLVLLEAALQSLALVVKVTGRNQSESWTSSNLRVLALGDSNTFGLYLEQEQSYPAQLEKIWNSQKGEDLPAIEVINLGYSGTNSSRLRANMKPVLERFQPDIVLVLVGANDVWTPAETVTVDSEVSTLSKLQKWSRVYRLYYMLHKEAFDRNQLDTGKRRTDLYSDTNAGSEQKWVEFALSETRKKEMLASSRPDISYGDQSFKFNPGQGKPAKTFDGLSANLVALKEIADAHNVRLVFLTYAANVSFYTPASHIIRTLALEKQFELIDVAQEFIVECPNAQVSCESLFFFDGHPRASGYQRMAQFVANKLKVMIKNRES